MLKNLKSLEYIDFECNKCISSKSSDFEAIKNELRIKCADPIELDETYCPEDLKQYASDIGELKTAIKNWQPACFETFDPLIDWYKLKDLRSDKLEKCRKSRLEKENPKTGEDCGKGNASVTRALPRLLFACFLFFY